MDGPSRLLTQVSSALTNNLMQARLAEASAGGARLLSLVPRLQRRVGLFDAAAMPCLVDAGRPAAEQALPAIRELLSHDDDRSLATPRWSRRLAPGLAHAD